MLDKSPYKGTRDFYPEDFRIRQYIFDVWTRISESFGYQQYDAPIIEPLDIYRAKTGEEIVNEQLYSFNDRGDREVAIRPEMTPSVARMVAAKRQELGYPLRLFSIPNVWRYERPQRGRLREHWQLNVDIFGENSNAAEIELIEFSHRLMKEFGANDEMYTIRVNSRKLMNVLLHDYLELSEENAYRVAKLIDRMKKMDKSIFLESLTDIVGDRTENLLTILEANELSALPDSVGTFAEPLKEVIAAASQLGAQNIVFDITLMRGFDYYTDIVFEVFDNHPDNNRSLFGGGRYDGLVGVFGVEDLSAFGVGIGDVGMRDFLQTHNLLPVQKSTLQLAILAIGDVRESAWELASSLRSAGVNVAVDSSGHKIEQMIKSANKNGAHFVMFYGETEVNSDKFELKNLSTGEKQTATLDEIPGIVVAT